MSNGEHPPSTGTSDETWMEVLPGRRNVGPRSRTRFWSNARKIFSQSYWLAKGNIRQSSVKTILGELWLLIDPILLACLYYFLIEIVLRAKAVSFSGILVSVLFWRLHQEIIVGAIELIRSKSAVLMQMNLPLSVIYGEYLLTYILEFGYKLAGIFLVLIVSGIFPSFSWLMIFPFLLAQIIFSASIAIFVSVAGVFVPDISRVIGLVVSIWWYLSPGMYTIDMIPERFHALYLLNPFAHILPVYQEALLQGGYPSLWPVVAIIALSVLIGGLSIWLLERARYYFFGYM
jgi:ABC-type polysaccharide/polyol phosphate export permease